MNGTEDEFVPEEEAEDGPGLVKKLRERLKKAVEEKQEYLEGWQRSRADFANYKREEAGMHTGREAATLAKLIETLLPALDSFEMALRHDPSKELQLVYKQLLGSLTKLGVEQFGQAGEEFDPRKHEALAQKGGEHRITSVERSGYSIGDTIIRPAQVII
jgi:molecular chaperone GrpE